MMTSRPLFGHPCGKLPPQGVLFLNPKLAGVLVLALLGISAGNVAAAQKVFWSLTAASPVTVVYAEAAFANGKVYLLGGATEESAGNDRVFEYDPATAVWTNCAPHPNCQPMPTPRVMFRAITGADGLIYAIGGANGLASALATVDVYDPATNTWSSRPPMTTPRAQFGLAQAGNGMIYAMGGYDYQPNETITASVEEFNPVTGTWTNCAPNPGCAPMPRGRAALAAATAGNGLVYAVGGRFSGFVDSVNTVEEFNPATNSWAMRAPLNFARSDHGVTARAGRIYAIGGWELYDERQVEEYDAALNQWRTVGESRAGTQFAAVATFGDRLMTIGGVDSWSKFTQVGTFVNVATRADVDGDSRSDLGVFNPASGNWFVQLSGGGTVSIPLGQNGDIPVPADYDGDNRVDLAIFRPAIGLWFAVLSGGGTLNVLLGQNGDIPVPADYDLDGRADVAIYRPSNPLCPGSGGLWFILGSAGGTISRCFGSSADVPVPGSYDIDGKADPGILQPVTSDFSYLGSDDQQVYHTRLVGGGMIAVPGEYDFDQRTERGHYGADGVWRVFLSTCLNGTVEGCTTAVPLGTGSDIPVPADYDGDGITDMGVFNPGNASWFVAGSTLGYLSAVLGQPGDIPLQKRPSYETYPFATAR